MPQSPIVNRSPRSSYAYPPPGAAASPAGSQADLARLLAAFSHFAAEASARAFAEWRSRTILQTDLIAKADAAALFIPLHRSLFRWRKGALRYATQRTNAAVQGQTAFLLAVRHASVRAWAKLRLSIKRAAALRFAAAWHEANLLATLPTIVSNHLHHWAAAASKHRRLLLAQRKWRSQASRRCIRTWIREAALGSANGRSRAGMMQALGLKRSTLQCWTAATARGREQARRMAAGEHFSQRGLMHRWQQRAQETALEARRSIDGRTMATAHALGRLFRALRVARDASEQMQVAQFCARLASLRRRLVQWQAEARRLEIFCSRGINRWRHNILSRSLRDWSRQFRALTAITEARTRGAQFHRQGVWARWLQHARAALGHQRATARAAAWHCGFCERCAWNAWVAVHTSTASLLSIMAQRRAFSGWMRNQVLFNADRTRTRDLLLVGLRFRQEVTFRSWADMASQRAALAAQQVIADDKVALFVRSGSSARFSVALTMTARLALRHWIHTTTGWARLLDSEHLVWVARTRRGLSRWHHSFLEACAVRERHLRFSSELASRERALTQGILHRTLLRCWKRWSIRCQAVDLGMWLRRAFRTLATRSAALVVLATCSVQVRKARKARSLVIWACAWWRVRVLFPTLAWRFAVSRGFDRLTANCLALQIWEDETRTLALIWHVHALLRRNWRVWSRHCARRQTEKRTFMELRNLNRIAACAEKFDRWAWTTCGKRARLASLNRRAISFGINQRFRVWKRFAVLVHKRQRVTALARTCLARRIWYSWIGFAFEPSHRYDRCLDHVRAQSKGPRGTLQPWVPPPGRTALLESPQRNKAIMAGGSPRKRLASPA